MKKKSVVILFLKKVSDLISLSTTPSLYYNLFDNITRNFTINDKNAF